MIAKLIFKTPSDPDRLYCNSNVGVLRQHLGKLYLSKIVEFL